MIFFLLLVVAIVATAVVLLALRDRSVRAALAGQVPAARSAHRSGV